MEYILVKIENKQQNLFHCNVLRSEEPWNLKSKSVMKDHSVRKENDVSLMGHSSPK